VTFLLADARDQTADFLSALKELPEAGFADKEAIVDRLGQSGHSSTRAVLTAFLEDRLYFRASDQRVFIVKSNDDALTSLDLIAPIREATGKLVGAYQVSGEYAGLCALGRAGLADFDAALIETWHVFRRAGAAYIITYGARRARSLGVPV